MSLKPFTIPSEKTQQQNVKSSFDSFGKRSQALGLTPPVLTKTKTPCRSCGGRK